MNLARSNQQPPDRVAESNPQSPARPERQPENYRDKKENEALTGQGREHGAGREPMTISVCIPTCRRPGLLREAIQSCLDQTRPPDEILVGDDAPGQGALEVVDEMRARLPGKIRYFENSPPLGQAGNVSRLYQQATSSHLLLLHDDDLLLPEALQELSSCWIRFPGLSAAFGLHAVMRSSGVIDWEASVRLNASGLRTSDRAGIQEPSWLPGLVQQFPGAGILIRTSAARDVVRNADPTDAVDYVFGVKFCTRFDGIYFLDRYVMVYRITPVSVSASWTNNAALSSYQFLERVPLPAEAEALRRQKLEEFAPLAIGQAVRVGKRREAMRIFWGPYHPLRSRLRPSSLARIAQLALPHQALKPLREWRRAQMDGPRGD